MEVLATTQIGRLILTQLTLVGSMYPKIWLPIPVRSHPARLRLFSTRPKTPGNPTYSRIIAQPSIGIAWHAAKLVNP